MPPVMPPRPASQSKWKVRKELKAMENATPEYKSNEPYVKMLSEFIRLFGCEELNELMAQSAVEDEELLRNVA